MQQGKHQEFEKKLHDQLISSTQQQMHELQQNRYVNLNNVDDLCSKWTTCVLLKKVVRFKWRREERESIIFMQNLRTTYINLGNFIKNLMEKAICYIFWLSLYYFSQIDGLQFKAMPIMPNSKQQRNFTYRITWLQYLLIVNNSSWQKQ